MRTQLLNTILPIFSIFFGLTSQNFIDFLKKYFLFSVNYYYSPRQIISYSMSLNNKQHISFAGFFSINHDFEVRITKCSFLLKHHSIFILQENSLFFFILIPIYSLRFFPLAIYLVWIYCLFFTAEQRSNLQGIVG